MTSDIVLYNIICRDRLYYLLHGRDQPCARFTRYEFMKQESRTSRNKNPRVEKFGGFPLSGAISSLNDASLLGCSPGSRFILREPGVRGSSSPGRPDPTPAEQGAGRSSGRAHRAAGEGEGETRTPQSRAWRRQSPWAPLVGSLDAFVS